MFGGGEGNWRTKVLITVGKLIRTKDPLADDTGKPQLQRCLTTLDLTSLGVGSCVGTGMYLVAGIVAHRIAGPGVILSFIIAAVASLFSGVCYAEFGVRVPHTTGSAYMYSYVTVGEFIAFVIGWNMILEYLIGTAAGACAISACIDAMVGGAINSAVKNAFGTIIGHTPDFVGALVTVMMTALMVTGVKKSLMVNNVLNVLNLAVWVFFMAVGVFYIDTNNWGDKHGGFLPHGWSGVLAGAATCFYAFIGFDIIATTGEEARNPRWSIPMAIILSLLIILTAYISSSVMLTLVVPWSDVDPDSGLVEMFAQRGAVKSKYIVAIGALAGLTVSMFGSMFPMPRIVYAMAKDGLIIRWLSQVWVKVGTPALATCVMGALTSVVALLVSLEVLVEMMSIGTLMAYTLVSTCVLLLRYQPQQTTLVDLLPESIRSACPTPSREQPPESSTTHITVKRINRMDSSDSESSPLSDIQPAWIPESATSANKSAYSNRNLEELGLFAADNTSRSEPVSDLFYVPLARLKSYIKLLSYRFPYQFRKPGPATELSGRFVMKLVGVLYVFILTFDLVVVCAMSSVESGNWFVLTVLMLLLAGIVACLFMIGKQPQSKCDLKFKAPCVPLVPVIAVFVNIYLILRLSIYTLIRFVVWMVFGMVMYFCYGIKHSSLEAFSESSIELKIPQDRLTKVREVEPCNEKTPINGDVLRLQLPQQQQNGILPVQQPERRTNWETFD